MDALITRHPSVIYLILRKRGLPVSALIGLLMSCCCFLVWLSISVYRLVMRKSEWPIKSCNVNRSPPFCTKYVANVWRSWYGVNLIPTFPQALRYCRPQRRRMEKNVRYFRMKSTVNTEKIGNMVVGKLYHKMVKMSRSPHCLFFDHRPFYTPLIGDVPDGKNVILCDDCGRPVYISMFDNETCRCESCNYVYQKERNAIKNKTYRHRKKLMSWPSPIKIEHDKIIGKCEYFIIFKNFSRRNPNEEIIIILYFWHTRKNKLKKHAVYRSNKILSNGKE